MGRGGVGGCGGVFLEFGFGREANNSEAFAFEQGLFLLQMYFWVFYFAYDWALSCVLEQNSRKNKAFAIVSLLDA